MLDSDSTDSTTTGPAATAGTVDQAAPPPRKRAPRKAAKKAAPGAEPGAEPAAEAPAPSSEPQLAAQPRKRTARKAAATQAPADADVDGTADSAAPAAGRAPRKAAAKAAAKSPTSSATKKASAAALVEAPGSDAPAPAKRQPRKRAAKKAGPAATDPAADFAAESAAVPAAQSATDTDSPLPTETPGMATPGVLFMAPAEEPRTRRTRKKAPATVLDEPLPTETDIAVAEDAEDETAEPEDIREAAIEQATGARRRRRRGRRGRGGAKADGTETDDDDTGEDDESGDRDAEGSDGAPADEAAEEEAGTRRRRRRRRSGSGDDDSGGDDPSNTVVHVRESRSSSDDGVRSVKGSTRLEAKRQRRRDGRETTRRRAPILTESEFLARREAVDRVMAVRQNGERTQIAVLEDDILVEHYVTRASATSYVGNVYLGRVQNVLPSMEAAFIDIAKGRNGVLYAGEVNWDAAGLEGKSRTIEHALKSGDPVLVQVTKDPIGHKGARLTSQISLPGRFLVLVPGGGMTGISRRLPDTERHRLKAILKKIVPEDAGVIVRTAAEGASEEDLTRDVERLTAQWEAIQHKAANTKAAPTLVHGEPDLATRVVRDVFNEDFKSLVVQGDDAWSTVSEYLEGVAPDLAQRVSKHVSHTDLFHELRVDEQLMKALDRKVWLPSGGSLIIDRTEAMTVIDVNTGKFVGAGGNLEQTVTRNNLEAAEEIVRQLRLRDVGGIVVVDFIDMVLESNRDLVLRRLTECLGRDRTKHQVAEVTSLGLVQMTRKRVGEGLLEAFSETCEHCRGRGVIIHGEPVDKSNGAAPITDDDRPAGKAKRKRGARAAAAPSPEPTEPPASDEQRRAASAAIAAIHRATAAEEAEAAAAGESGLSGLDGLASELVAAARAAADEGEAPTASTPTAPAESVEPAGEVEADGANASEQSTPAPRRRRRAASRPAGPPAAVVQQ